MDRINNSVYDQLHVSHITWLKIGLRNGLRSAMKGHDAKLHMGSVMTSCFRYSAAIVLALMSPPVKADYLPLELGALFRDSDIIGLGVIEAVADDTFEFRGSNIFTGTASDSPISVARYVDWPDGRRWTGYARGQTVFLFLDASDGTDVWKIRGAAGEGEMPVIDGQVYLHGVNLDGLERRVHNVDRGEIYGYRVDLETFVDALTGYRKCFASTGSTDRACSKEGIEAYRKNSQLNAILTEKATEH